MFKNKLYFSSIFLSLLINLSVMAAARPTIYPPYPEVWGYDLSTFPDIKNGTGGVTAFAMDNGDIWFLVDYSHKIKSSMDDAKEKTDDKQVLIKFFKNEQKELSKKELKNFYKLIHQRKGLKLATTGTEEHIFSDGSKLEFSYERYLRNFFKPDFYDQSFLKTHPNGDEKRYSILAAASQISMRKIYDDREEEQAPFLYQKLYSLGNPLYLKDDTFIVFCRGGNLILRFNKDFETKFQPKERLRTVNDDYIERNFFIIDYKLIDELIDKFYDKSPRPLSLWQSLHDDLLCYFHTQYKIENQEKL